MSQHLQDNPLSTQFPWKLYNLLERFSYVDEEPSIRWLHDGLSFQVVDKARFARNVMPLYFKSSMYKSFQRNLNLWGWKAVDKNEGQAIYHHEFFVRGKPHLLQQINRRQSQANFQSTPLDQVAQQLHSKPKPKPPAQIFSTLQALGTAEHEPTPPTSSPQPTYSAGLLIQLALMAQPQHVTSNLIEKLSMFQQPPAAPLSFNFPTSPPTNDGTSKRKSVREQLENTSSSLKRAKDHEQQPSSEDSLKRIPCRARGMPLTHNIHTAYFSFDPKTIEHGADLACADPTCNRGGVKFRYCAVCQVPASKRTFSYFHTHREDRKSSPEGAGQPRPEQVETKASATKTRTQKRKRFDQDAFEADRQSTMIPKEIRLTPSLSAAIHHAPMPSDTSSVSSIQRRAWAALLGRRPDKDAPAEEFQAWLSDVLDISHHVRPEA